MLLLSFAALDQPVLADVVAPVEECYSVAPGAVRVYGSGADALEGGAISLDDAARVASENGIDMRAISLQYEGGTPSNHVREISRTPGFHIPEEAGATLAGDLAELFMRGG